LIVVAICFCTDSLSDDLDNLLAGLEARRAEAPAVSYSVRTTRGKSNGPSFFQIEGDIDEKLITVRKLGLARFEKD